MKSKRDREEACYICGHYHDYEGGQPCTICGHVMAAHERKENSTVLPTAIIPGFLYLGSYDTASRSELLKAMAITHILNTVPTCQALFKNTFTYHTVACTPPDFQECFSFIDSVSQSDGKVLIYCMSGLSRSPTVVIAYLMKLRGWRLAESYKWVKDKRPSININAEDTKRLIAMETELHGSCSVPNGFAAIDASCAGGFLCPATGQPTASSSAQPGSPFPVSFGNQPQWSLASAGPPAAVSFGGGSTAPSGTFVFGGGQGSAQQQQDQGNTMEA